jgi:hypothetical protein
MVQSDQRFDEVAITQERKRDAVVGIAWRKDPANVPGAVDHVSFG